MRTAVHFIKTLASRSQK